MSESIYAGLPEKLVAALKRCDLLAGPEQLNYYYELYDPKTGGFYYSISSRDCEGMTPFSEGTRFSIEALRYGGITFPDWWKEKCGNWIRGHQDESDGFFYEDLWGKITFGPRLYRDLTYSVDILTAYCDMQPKYMLPADRVKGGDVSSTIPERLSSKEKMLEYLDGLDWSYKGIWSTGQKLTNEQSLMKATGLWDMVYEYILARQNPETGLWGDGFGWMNTNGTMKLSGFFDKEHPFPNFELALDSIVKLYTGDEPPTSATWIWNPFVAMSRAFYSLGEKGDALRPLLYDKGADIVNCAVDNALKLQRADGGFASSPVRGAARQQGFLFGYGLKDESDLDGTLIAGPRLRNTIHSTFGIKAPGGYYAHMNDEFWEKCKNKPEIVKTLPYPADQPITTAKR